MALEELVGSASLEILDLVLKKVSAGENVISLAIGEPVFDTPKEINDAAIDGINSGMTHYISSYGSPEFREAVVSKVRRKNNIKCYSDNTIFISSKMSIYASFVAIYSARDDEVLVPNPGYFYAEPAILAGLTPVSYHLNSDYSLNIDLIREKISKKTKAIVINTPANPTGRIYSERDLKELYSLCLERKIKILSDEAYEDLVYEKKHFSIASLESEPNIVISIFTLSKSYSMTGWRAGYIVAEKKFIDRLAKFMEHAFTCFPPFIQHASAVALTKCDRQVQEFKKAFTERRDYAVKRLNEIPQFTVNNVEGAFYIFPKYSLNISSRKLCDKILNEKNVAILPGNAFGTLGEGHVRFSYSGSMDTLEEGMDRIAEFFKSL
ncbi:MAG: aminotransferase class I/II-fold pyridoxal phosphate-dependent enzyme [Candidatus Thermoplasmatota archaeon]|nr:aminotransferase class I/II-fold pyridoxal phosphate-dependent enzyme [Candidatus Thermoplasmatota archaeon]